jgi:hypothetical protein
VEEFTHTVNVDGTDITFGVKIVEIRPAGDYVHTTPAPFASFNDGKIMPYKQWCEYVLTWPYDNDPTEGLDWYSIECDNGNESQRHDATGAREAAIGTLNELATGTMTLVELFGEME